MISTIYKDLSINLYTFTNDHLKNMLNTFHHENKSFILTGNFNVNFINYNKKEAHLSYSYISHVTL